MRKGSMIVCQRSIGLTVSDQQLAAEGRVFDAPGPFAVEDGVDC
jgi:hypothetical protein